MITVGITRKSETNEYRVFWRENGVDSEDKAAYTDDPQDAVFTAIATIRRAREYGYNVELSNAKYTIAMFVKHAPEFLVEERRWPVRGSS
jgi:hypothetical protein